MTLKNSHRFCHHPAMQRNSVVALLALALALVVGANAARHRDHIRGASSKATSLASFYSSTAELPPIDEEGYKQDWHTEHRNDPYPEDAEGKWHHPEHNGQPEYHGRYHPEHNSS